ncbi:MAG: hypothetical protein JNJ94_12720 [Chlorobi bacterium]|nr:hypothetical protein [Chlorobiota bacterium]
MAQYSCDDIEKPLDPITDNHPIRGFLDSGFLYPKSVKVITETTLVLVWRNTYGFARLDELTENVRAVLKNWKVVSTENAVGSRGLEIHITIEQVSGEKLIEKRK